jgi:hypothetical protein
MLPPATAPPENQPAGPEAAPAVAPAAQPAAPAAQPVPPKPGGPVKISFSKEEIGAVAGNTFELTVEVENARDVTASPFMFQYDPKFIQVEDVTAGKFWSSDGQTPAPPIKNIQNEAGLATVRVTRKPGTPPVAGSGTLLTLTLKALKAGQTSFSANNVTLNNSQDQMLGSGHPTVSVTIK